MSNMVDLLSLLCLDARLSQSSFGGKHRTILISKDFTNSGDFVFNNLLQHFARKEPQASILLITLSQEWSHYSASAAKCGINLRRSQNSGNIDILSISAKLLETIKSVSDWKPCDYIDENVKSFIDTHLSKRINSTANVNPHQPLIVMIDDLSILTSLGCQANHIFRLFSSINNALKDASSRLDETKVNYFVVQTMTTLVNSKSNSQQGTPDDLNYLVTNLENLCDISVSLRPLDTGYSTRVDGTIKIVDNRLPMVEKTPTSSHTKLLPPAFTLTSAAKSDIGMKKAFFFKLCDRRVRLTSSALIF